LRVAIKTVEFWATMLRRKAAQYPNFNGQTGNQMS